MANNDLQNITKKTKHKATRTPQKGWGELRCFGRISSSCFSSDTHFVTLVSIPDDIVQCQLAEIGIIIAYLISPYRLKEGRGGLWCLVPLSILFHLFRGTQFY